MSDSENPINGTENSKTELDDIFHDIQQKQNELINIQNEIQTLKTEQETIKSDLANKQSEFEKINNEIINKQDELNAVQNDIAKNQNKLETIKTEITTKESELAIISNEIQAKESELNSIKKDIKVNQTDLSNITAEISKNKAKIKKDEEKIKELEGKIKELEKNAGLYQTSLQGITKQNTKFKRTYNIYAGFVLVFIIIFSLATLITILMPELFASGIFSFEKYGQYFQGLKNHDYKSIVIFKLPILTLLLFLIYALFKLFRGFISLNITANKQMNGLLSISFLLKEIRDSRNTENLQPAEKLNIEKEILKEQYTKLAQYIDGLIKQNYDQFIELSNVKHPLEHMKEIFDSFSKNMIEMAKTFRDTIPK